MLEVQWPVTLNLHLKTLTNTILKQLYYILKAVRSARKSTLINPNRNYLWTTVIC